jgi:L-fucose mutarotase
MGHGDVLVIGDGNFPAASMNPHCIRCDGHGAAELLNAILELFPLDTFMEAPVTLMQVVAGSINRNPPIWEEFRTIIEKNQPGTAIQFAERFAFYDLSRKAYATVQTGEKALYACIILRKGVLGG